MSVARELRVLLLLRNFRRLLAVRLLSQSADGIYQVALTTYVVLSPERQTSAAAIASAMAVLLLPYSLLAPFTGVLLDRWQRRQVLLYGNLLRTALATGTALLILAEVPDWLFYVSALSVTAINRFILTGLAAALPRVVGDPHRLVMANSISPTAGTLAATAGGGAAFAVRLLGTDSDAVVVLLGAALYLCAALASLRMQRELLGPELEPAQPRLEMTLAGTAHGLASGLHHLSQQRPAVHALTAMTLMRFCYGALTVMVLLLSRYAWPDEDSGLALLGAAVAMSGAGFFAAAVCTPRAVERLGPFGWIGVCAGAAAVLEPALGLLFTPVPMLIAAFVLGVTTQGSKVATDTIVQSSVDDAFRGRVFSLYDVLFNVAFVGAAGVSALILPPDGRSVTLVVSVALIYTGVAITTMRAAKSA